MEQQNISDYNLFMMCRAPREEAFAPLPAGFHFDLCRREELETWMRFPFDTQEEARQYAPFMARYFQNVYAAKEAEFFARCLFVREASGAPVGTAFLWRAYGRVNTLHWLKVRREYEGRGIGRALLTRLLMPLALEEYPVYLHTQPSSYRAIKLYTDFGFALLTDARIGPRENHLAQSLPFLRQAMPPAAYANLAFAQAPEALLAAAASRDVDEF